MSIGASGGRLLRASQKEVWVDRLIDQAFRAAARLWPLALIVVSMLLFLPGLDIRPFRGEEARRALQALAMLEHGAWWRLEVLDRQYVNKPPLLPWAIAGLAALSGKLDEFAVRLPIVLSTMAGALTAGALATRMVDSERGHLAGLLAGLAFLLSGYIQMKARVAETDVPSIALVGAGFMAWALGRLSDTRLPAWWTLSAVTLALAALARGPIPLTFVAVPMLATEFLDKQRGRPMAVVLVLAAAMLPCLAWAASNLGGGHNLHQWALEMHLITDQSVAEHLRTLLLLGRIPHALILLLPWLVFALAWALFRAADAQPGQGWLVRALLLYIGPLSLLVLLWPASRERYAMPIVWPIAVLAGVAMTNLWNDRRFVARTAAAALVVALAFQYMVAFGIDGKNDYQRAVRHAAGTLQRLVANSGPGEFLVVVAGDEPDHGLLGYLPRTVLRVVPADVGGTARHLAASQGAVAELLGTGGWVIIGGPDVTDFTFLERKP